MRMMTSQEIALVKKIIKQDPSVNISPEALAALPVAEANDGGMGGLVFLSKNKERSLGRDIGVYEFNDIDGVKVLVTLSLDNFGELYELDIWKTDFSKLMGLPNGFEEVA